MLGLLIGQRMVPAVAQQAQRPMLAEARRRVGSEAFLGGPAFEYATQMQPQLLKGHRLGFAAIKAVRPDLPTGFSLAIVDEQSAGSDSLRDKVRQEFYGTWLEMARQDDFIGVQNYGRNVWDAKGVLPPPAGARLNADGGEVHPASLANAARYASQQCGQPVLVTEHGVLTDDDRLRAETIPLALAELKRAIDDGVRVIGYLHWSLIDNFEWISGFKSHYGLASCDRAAFERRLKPSASVLGTISRKNSL